MKKTSPVWLVAAGGFLAAVAAILTWRFYGSLTSIPTSVSISLWILSAVCVIAAILVKNRLGEGKIGQDRSQLSPLTVAFLAMLGKAAAWTGAIIGGLYIGVSSFLIPRAGELVAAQEDLPGALSSALGGVVLAVAGLHLERCCAVPPPQAGEPIS